jgi:hypothetical protein
MRNLVVHQARKHEPNFVVDARSDSYHVASHHSGLRMTEKLSRPQCAFSLKSFFAYDGNHSRLMLLC